MKQLRNYHLPASSITPIATEPKAGTSIWLNQTVRTSPIELAFIAIGHVALGFIFGIAFFGG